jgi:hypothetical protein
MQANLNTHQKGLLCWCGQRLCFQAYLRFQIITLADCIYWTSQRAVTNQNISSHDDRIYTSHQPWFLLQSPPLAADCYILSNFHSLALSKRNATASGACLPQRSFYPPSNLRRIHSSTKHSVVDVKRPRVSARDLFAISRHIMTRWKRLTWEWMTVHEEHCPQNGHQTPQMRPELSSLAHWKWWRGSYWKSGRGPNVGWQVADKIRANRCEGAASCKLKQLQTWRLREERCIGYRRWIWWDGRCWWSEKAVVEWVWKAWDLVILIGLLNPFLT